MNNSTKINVRLSLKNLQMIDDIINQRQHLFTQKITLSDVIKASIKHTYSQINSDKTTIIKDSIIDLEFKKLAQPTLDKYEILLQKLIKLNTDTIILKDLINEKITNKNKQKSIIFDDKDFI